MTTEELNKKNGAVAPLPGGPPLWQGTEGRLFADMRKTLADLRTDNAQLCADLERTRKLVRRCIVLLREAREKNRKLHLKLGGN